MVRAALVDDMENEREMIKAELTAFAREKRTELRIDEYSSGEEFMSSFVPGAFDIIFLDIYMDEMTGIDTARKIREKDDQSLIMFLTTSREHMGDAFSIHAFDYVEKPIDKERLRTSLEDAFEMLPEQTEQITFVSGGIEVSLAMRDIFVVKSAGHNVDIVSRSGRTYQTKGPFSNVAEQLQAHENFLLISRGILVNMDEITEFTEHTCCLSNGMAESITVRRRKKLVQAWHDYEFAKMHRKAARQRKKL